MVAGIHCSLVHCGSALVDFIPRNWNEKRQKPVSKQPWTCNESRPFILWLIAYGVGPAAPGAIFLMLLPLIPAHVCKGITSKPLKNDLKMLKKYEDKR